MPYDVITIGSGTIDVFVKTTGDDLIDIKTASSEEKFTCYPLGAKILIKDLQFMTGGGGTNTAVSFSRLGMKTAYLSNLGSDENGRKVISELKKEKVSFIGTTGKQKTNYSVILDSIGHDRTILAYRDASEYLDFNKIKKSSLKSKWFYLSSMTGKSFETSKKLMAYARKNGIKVAYNPSLYQVKEGRKKLKPLLSNTDVLVFNREEAATLLGMKKEDSVETMLDEVRNLGPKIVVITEGSRMINCSDGICVYSLKPRNMKIMETTGAGDAFASGFIAGLARNKGIEDAMRIGLANAQSVIRHYGAKNRLLKWNEAVKEMEKEPKVGKREI
ncbi:MAG: carbohydrate kinase family protein [Candidatus Woesearchaeota archaeon]